MNISLTLRIRHVPQEYVRPFQDLLLIRISAEVVVFVQDSALSAQLQVKSKSRLKLIRINVLSAALVRILVSLALYSRNNAERMIIV